MRSCIYCGRELEKGEKCTCARSTANRQGQREASDTGKNTQSDSTYNGEYRYNDPERTQYRTGYTKKDNRFKKAFEKARVKRAARARSGMNRGFWKTQLQRIAESLRDPVAAVQNPKDMSMGAMFGLWALLGAVMWLCIYFIVTNVPRGAFSMLANIMSFNGITGYKIIGYMLMTMLSGAASGIIMFLAYTGVFYAINRFVFRDRQTSYRAMSQRLALTSVPFTAVAVVGALISAFSSTTLMILLLIGAVSFVVLTYEALKAQWIYAAQGKVVYGMMLGMFILLTLMCYIIRLS